MNRKEKGEGRVLGNGFPHPKDTPPRGVVLPFFALFREFINLKQTVKIVHFPQQNGLTFPKRVPRGHFARANWMNQNLTAGAVRAASLASKKALFTWKPAIPAQMLLGNWRT